MLLLKKVPLQKSDTKWETKKLSFQSLWLFLSVTSWLCLRILWFFPRKIWLMSYVMLQMFTKQILQITIFAFSSVFLSYGHTSSLIQSYLHQNSLVSHLISLFPFPLSPLFHEWLELLSRGKYSWHCILR